MKRILIVNPPFYRLQKSTLIHYPQGPAYMAAMLERAGYKPVIYNADYDGARATIVGNTNHINVKKLNRIADTYVTRLHDEQDPVWIELRDYIASYKPDILIVSVFNTTLTAGLRVAKIARDVSSSTRIAFESFINRGLHSAVDATPALTDPHLDFVIRRDPEETAVELVQAIEAGHTDFSGVLGLSWKRDGQIIRNADRSGIEDLDSLPFPARHLVDGHEKMHPHTWQGILGGRGCPFKCTFCGVPNSGGSQVRLRSAKSIVDEMQHVYEIYGTRYFYMCEDIFLIRRPRVQEFCELILERELPLYWSCQTRAELIDDKTAALMKRAGGQHVAVGVESGNQKSREIMRKDNTVEDVRRCAEVIRRNGLRMVSFVILGLPWESAREVWETYALLEEIDPYIVYPYLPTPVKGTELAHVMMNDAPTLPDGGWSELRDRCHTSLEAIQVQNGQAAQEKREAVAEALKKLMRRNRRRLVRDVFERPQFYYALARDMGFHKRPGNLLQHARDLLVGA